MWCSFHILIPVIRPIEIYSALGRDCAVNGFEVLGIFAAFHSACNSFIDFLNNNSLRECGAIKPGRRAVTAALTKDCVL